MSNNKLFNIINYNLYGATGVQDFFFVMYKMINLSDFSKCLRWNPLLSISQGVVYEEVTHLRALLETCL